MTFRKAWDEGNFSAYDGADTLADAATAYRRCRAMKTFRLADDSPDLKRVTCSTCGRKLSEFAAGEDHPEKAETRDAYHGNRVEYSPKQKLFKPKHYVCAWGGLLGALATGDEAEALANIRKVNAQGWQRLTEGGTK